MKNTQSKMKSINLENNLEQNIVLVAKIIQRYFSHHREVSLEVKMINKVLREKSHCVAC